MTTPITTPTGFVKNEPVYAAALVTWLLSLAGTLVLGHTDLITSNQWSSLSTILVPLVSGLVLAGVAFLTRKVVTPAWKLLTAEAEKLGLSPAQEAKIVATVDKRVTDALDARLLSNQPAPHPHPGPGPQ